MQNSGFLTEFLNEGSDLYDKHSALLQVSGHRKNKCQATSYPKDLTNLDNKAHWQPPGNLQMFSHHWDVASSLDISRSTAVVFPPSGCSG